MFLQILDHLNPVLVENSEKLEKILRGIYWQDFPGVQALLMKGCTNQATADATWHLLSRLTSCLRSKIIAPSRTTEEDGMTSRSVSHTHARCVSVFVYIL